MTPRAPRWSFEEWADATLMLLKRQRSKCPLCGTRLDSVERHHRVRRRDGGDRLSNIVMLHPDCHRWAHANPEEARHLGYIVSAWGDPLSAPMWDKGLRCWMTLDDEGEWLRLEPPIAGFDV